jgi:hypothetical protein
MCLLSVSQQIITPRKRVLTTFFRTKKLGFLVMASMSSFNMAPEIFVRCESQCARSKVAGMWLSVGFVVLSVEGQSIREMQRKQAH